MPGLVPGIHVAPTMTGESRREAVPAKVYAVAADAPAMRPNTEPEVNPLPPG